MKVIISGCNGKMGRVLVRLIANEKEMEIVAGIDKHKDKFENTFPVYEKACECKEKADVLIDFSHHSAFSDILKYCLDTKTPLVMATTGLTGENLRSLMKASNEIPIFQTGNYSLGVNVITNLAKKAAASLGDDFDIEIIEKHHNQKVDSPSGTAYLIANGINEAFETKKEFVYGRYGKSDKRTSTEIGIHAIRGGTIIGEHTVIFAGPDEIIEIKHTALSKDIFGLGAIKASKFLIKQKNGFYNMNDMLK
ncbi:4-hydroxy-tetrahydrodipicolinate reductase [Crassaminicella thermophila]|uniref:4-hydroxy-tetrahydrodipicolinate reductase n=1 Tax=Crassaminicella thermophila TaxID=2599308 RepID=A0A5C0SHV1_CRATE|nr:4-hydroxy-tetrahydrodipicolinate reductase [Crassaminicella thermophila]QEK12529.1 4-hydroxy-tetrahydrodipicolinate reductase [Crassaminicella thermophila]